MQHGVNAANQHDPQEHLKHKEYVFKESKKGAFATEMKIAVKRARALQEESTSIVKRIVYYKITGNHHIITRCFFSPTTCHSSS